MDCRSKYCIIGAGSSGLTAAKNLLQQGIDCEVLEREDELGGNWCYGKPHSSVYRSTHLISSKRLTEFVDYPMPEDYPEYPNHQQVFEYLRSYAQHFGLYDVIQFQTPVKWCEPDEQGWQVTLENGQRRGYHGLIIANGHNWDPNWPAYAGSFQGTVLHSSQYKTPDVLAGRRVLVVGAGNSGCDIAVESAEHATKTWQSTRRGYHYLPKFLHGKPIDQCGERMLRWRLPLWMRRSISTLAVRFAVGAPQAYGLPKPDHKLFETHPIINSRMLYEVGHGRITPKPDIARLDGDKVQFVDGSCEAVDVIIYATGFRISFPFIDPQHLNWRDGRPDLWLNVFHPKRSDLFVAGLIQPDSGQWGLVDWQARLIARFIRASQTGQRQADWLRRQMRRRLDLSDGTRYIRSTRHLLEVEHFSYRRRLQKLVRKMEA